jgi:putative cytotoxic protein
VPLQGLKNCKKGIKTNGLSGTARRFSECDNLHSEIEVYDRFGDHLGTADPVTGEATGGGRIRARRCVLLGAEPRQAICQHGYRVGNTSTSTGVRVAV